MRPQLLDALTGERRRLQHERSLRPSTPPATVRPGTTGPAPPVMPSSAAAPPLSTRSALFEHDDPRLVTRAQLVEHRLHRAAMLGRVPVGQVDHLDQHVGPGHLFQGRLEGVDQLVRQLVDETHGVAHDHRLTLAQAHAPGRRVERGEQHVLDRGGFFAHQGVQQGRLAGVGVAHDGHGGQQTALARASRRLATAPHFFHALPRLLDALAEHPAVGLELGLARAPAGADAASHAREVRPHAGETRQLVLQLRQLHLDAALVRVRPLGEDVEDDAAAVEHLDVEQILQRALLAAATARRRRRAG